MCIGDSITQNCTVDSLNHVWIFGAIEAGSLSLATTMDQMVMGFTFRRVSTGSTAIISSVSGTVTPELNNTVIVCLDGNQNREQAERQETTIMIFDGKLSSPLPLIWSCTFSYN